MKAAGSAAPSWQGASAQAFAAAASCLVGELDGRAGELARGAGVMDDYAEVLERAHALAAELRVQAAGVLVTAIAGPAVAPACQALATTITSAFNGLLSTVDMAAANAAASLTAGSSDRAASEKGKGGEKKSTEDKNGFGQDLERLKEQADGKGDWDPDANQTALPDCFMLVSLQGYSATEEGQQYLRDHVRWDEGKNCFVVTLYGDNGKPVDVEVRDYYSNGSKDERGRPTLMSIYERAYGQLFGEEGLNNRPPSEAMKRVSGHAATPVDTEGGPGLFGWLTGEDHKYTGKEWATIDRAVDEGRPVVAVTAGDIKENTTVRAVTDTNGDGKIDTSNKGSNGEPPDQEVTRRLGGGHKTQDGGKTAHAYTVVAVDDRYVTLRNPWGVNPDSDGNPMDTGLIRITREDYERYFSVTDIGADPK